VSTKAADSGINVDDQIALSKCPETLWLTVQTAWCSRRKNQAADADRAAEARVASAL